MAIELTLGGAQVLVLERLATPSMVSKALGVGPLGSEALQRRGMAAALATAEAQQFTAAKKSTERNAPGPGPEFIGHFAGLTLLRANAQKEPRRRGRPVDQQAIEAMLAERASSLGIEVRRECNVVNLVHQNDCVDVNWTSPAGAGRVRCSWLVGCDGGRSPVRKMAGFDFPGTPPTLTMYTAAAEIDHPERLLPIGWRHTSGGMFSYGMLPGRLFLLDFRGPPEDRHAPVTREEFEAVLRHISGADVRVKALASASRWTDNTRLVDTYRQGRVLLAGDAAHIHSPFGGQGMSLGLVDAANLGWKLAAVIRGTMPDSLLDTYTAERRPAAEAVLANTRAQTAIMRPDPQSAAMRQLIANLLQFDDVNRSISEMMRGLATSYDLGSDRDGVGSLVSDMQVDRSGTPLYDFMQDGKGVLLDASAGEQASKLVAGTALPNLRCVAVDTGRSMLIRPDACLTWLGEGNSIAGLKEALGQWFMPGLLDEAVERCES